MDNDAPDQQAHADAMRTSSQLAATVIAGTTPDQHGGPTPCTAFSVADVINHRADSGRCSGRRVGRRLRSGGTAYGAALVGPGCLGAYDPPADVVQAAIAGWRGLAETRPGPPDWADLS